MIALRTAWLRGGTSKGLFFRGCDVLGAGPGPALDALLLAALGSPDPSGLQLNGVGGGLSSTSKVCIVSPSKRAGHDVDYLFAQVEIKERRVNWEGSCGNLSAGVGLFALAEGLVPPKFDASGKHTLRVWQVNQGYSMSLHVPDGIAAPLPDRGAGLPRPEKMMALAGVPGREPPLYVELEKPCGDKALLPTGNEVDRLTSLDGSSVEATLVTAGNPTVFVFASSVGLQGNELPEQMDYGRVLPLVDHLRKQAAPLFGMEGPGDQPRVAFLAPPSSYRSSSGEDVSAEAHDISSRISTPGRIHHAHTGTGSIALACAAQIEGSVPWRCFAGSSRPPAERALRIGHPGGVMEVRADVRKNQSGQWEAIGAGFDRTARYLMRGEVFVPVGDRAP